MFFQTADGDMGLGIEKEGRELALHAARHEDRKKVALGGPVCPRILKPEDVLIS